VHLFLGPEGIPPAYYIRLGKHGSSVRGLSTFAHAQLFLYGDQTTEAAKAGVVKQAEVVVLGNQLHITNRLSDVQ
jgi:hypothetical protein